MRLLPACEVEPMMVLDLAHDAVADPTGRDPDFADRRARVATVTRALSEVRLGLGTRSVILTADHVVMMVEDEEGRVA